MVSVIESGTQRRRDVMIFHPLLARRILREVEAQAA